jgi:hypothetical protein
LKVERKRFGIYTEGTESTEDTEKREEKDSLTQRHRVSQRRTRRKNEETSRKKRFRDPRGRESSA